MSKVRIPKTEHRSQRRKRRRHEFFFGAVVVGACLVLNVFNSGPLQPDNTEERVIMFLTKLALAALGIWMVVCGVKLKAPTDT